MMGEVTQELTNTNQTSNNQASRRAARKRTPTATPTSPAHIAEPQPGEGAERLRSAINKRVSQDCEKIANALVERTIAGNMTGAELLADLTGAKHLHNQPVKKRSGPSQAQLLMLQPPWQGPPDPKVDLSLGFCEPKR
jgi:hypothetical protein